MIYNNQVMLLYRYIFYKHFLHFFMSILQRKRTQFWDSNFTGCSTSNTTLTTAVSVSFGDINITRQTSCFFSFYLLGRTYRTALQQILKISIHHLIEYKHPPEILLPVGLMLSYSVLPCQDTRCWMLHEQQQTISIRSNVREIKHILLVNTQCSHP
jgi:hypothetical protein